ncbi:MAG: hypothetical protein ABIR17_07465 [Pseudolysinimonas sp.]|uniref:hypothetical protein n=1 Tax=Pseudolysinimonas sp. TaxID=2680009 RepID=UPI0032650A4E
MAPPKQLTTQDTLGTWLKHPTGGPIVRDLLTQFGVDEKMLGPFKLFRVEKVVAMSNGAITQDMLDDIVRQANAPTTS